MPVPSTGSVRAEHGSQRADPELRTGQASGALPVSMARANQGTTPLPASGPSKYCARQDLRTDTACGGAPPSLSPSESVTELVLSLLRH